jgi:hypothetical protein
MVISEDCDKENGTSKMRRSVSKIGIIQSVIARGFHQQLGSANVGHCVNMPTTRLNITGPVLVDIYC